MDLGDTGNLCVLSVCARAILFSSTDAQVIPDREVEGLSLPCRCLAFSFSFLIKPARIGSEQWCQVVVLGIYSIAF